jgi:hypothetical protein
VIFDYKEDTGTVLHKETIADDLKEYVENTNKLCGLSAELLVRNLSLCTVIIGLVRDKESSVTKR